jgi:hypothetical protein
MDGSRALTDPQLIHIVGVTAVWVIFLSSLRFATAGLRDLWPVVRATWHLWTCPHRDTPSCRRRWQYAMDELHIEFFAAVTSPWSVALLTGGMALIGGGLAFGSIGDVAQLVSNRPNVLDAFDRGADAASALLVCTGMAMVLAALSKRRMLSTWISTGFLLTGLGVGIVTAL